MVGPPISMAIEWDNVEIKGKVFGKSVTSLECLLVPYDRRSCS